MALANTANTGGFFLNAGELSLTAGGALTAPTMSGQGTLNLDGGALTLTGSNTLHLYGVRVGR